MCFSRSWLSGVVEWWCLVGGEKENGGGGDFTAKFLQFKATSAHFLFHPIIFASSLQYISSGIYLLDVNCGVHYLITHNREGNRKKNT